MSFEQPENKEIMETEKVLYYMTQLTKDLENNIKAVQAMIEEAKEKGIEVNLLDNEELKKFAPLGENEIALINLNNSAHKISSELFKQGVKMTKEDLDNRLEKMGKSKLEIAGQDFN